jgi:2-polyprenyl-3-methyl-5-hydroxy-6-metoxy-1,4-benzoquinol methylase
VFLANAFPNSRFIGFDVSEKAIEQAQQVKEEKGLKNVEFLLMDAKEFKSEWTDKFDLIISFDSFHHHEHPDKVIIEKWCGDS